MIIYRKDAKDAKKNMSFRRENLYAFAVRNSIFAIIHSWFQLSLLLGGMRSLRPTGGFLSDKSLRKRSASM